MSTETRFRSKPEDVGSSSGSGNEESSTSRPSNERKTKRYVKKKGEARKRNSIENGPQQSPGPELPEMNKISMKLEKMTIKTEAGETGAANPPENNNEKANKKGEEKPAKTRKNGRQNSGVEKERKSKSGKEKETVPGPEEAGKKEDREKSPPPKESVNSKEHLPDKRQGLTKNLDKGKTVEQRKRDRQTARFAKAVARFSMKFTKAAKELGIIYPENGSTSWSDSSSTCTDSCSSSCTCSGCCTTDSSTCSCSDCHSKNCSTCSSTDSSFSSPTSSSSPNSSTSTTSSSTSSSSSEISDRVTNH